MKNLKSIVFLLIYVCLSGCNVSADIALKWDEFLAQPRKDTYSELERHITSSAKECSWGNVVNDTVLPVETRQHFFKLIAEGNEFAFRAGVLVEKCLDGGELGDFYRHAGLYFESNPELFLNTIKIKSTSEASFKSMLIMLPEITVDDIDQQIYVIQKRIALLENINKDELLGLKDTGLLFLKEQEASLININNNGSGRVIKE